MLQRDPDITAASVIDDSELSELLRNDKFDSKKPNPVQQPRPVHQQVQQQPRPVHQQNQQQPRPLNQN